MTPPITIGCTACGSPRRASATCGRPGTGVSAMGFMRSTAGYWGPTVGFYGGINYGYGYGGYGYYGGRWDGRVFRYNTAVTRVNVNNIHNTYVDNTLPRPHQQPRQLQRPGRHLRARPTPASAPLPTPLTSVRPPRRTERSQARSMRTPPGATPHGRPNPEPARHTRGPHGWQSPTPASRATKLLECASRGITRNRSVRTRALIRSTAMRNSSQRTNRSSAASCAANARIAAAARKQSSRATPVGRPRGGACRAGHREPGALPVTQRAPQNIARRGDGKRTLIARPKPRRGASPKKGWPLRGNPIFVSWLTAAARKNADFLFT